MFNVDGIAAPSSATTAALKTYLQEKAPILTAPPAVKAAALAAGAPTAPPAASSPARSLPWGWIAVGGAALVGLFFYLRGGSEEPAS